MYFLTFTLGVIAFCGEGILLYARFENLKTYDILSLLSLVSVWNAEC